MSKKEKKQPVHACRFHTFDSGPLGVKIEHINERVCIKTASDKRHSGPLKDGDEIIAINGVPVQPYVNNRDFTDVAVKWKKMERAQGPIEVEFLAKEITLPYISLCFVEPLWHIRIADHAIILDPASKKTVTYYTVTLKAPAGQRMNQGDAIFSTRKRYSEFRAMKQKLAYLLPRLHDCLPPFPSRDINKSKAPQVSREKSKLADDVEEPIDEDEEGLLRRQKALEAYMQGLDRVCTEGNATTGAWVCLIVCLISLMLPSLSINGAEPTDTKQQANSRAGVRAILARFIFGADTVKQLKGQESKRESSRLAPEPRTKGNLRRGSRQRACSDIVSTSNGSPGSYTQRIASSPEKRSLARSPSSLLPRGASSCKEALDYDGFDSDRSSIDGSAGIGSGDDDDNDDDDDDEVESGEWGHADHSRQFLQLRSAASAKARQQGRCWGASDEEAAHTASTTSSTSSSPTDNSPVGRELILSRLLAPGGGRQVQRGEAKHGVRPVASKQGLGAGVSQSVRTIRWVRDREVVECSSSSCSVRFRPSGKLQKAFSFGRNKSKNRRRHHCRLCGQIFCGNCAPRQSWSQLKLAARAGLAKDWEAECLQAETVAEDGEDGEDEGEYGEEDEIRRQESFSTTQDVMAMAVAADGYSGVGQRSVSRVGGGLESRSQKLKLQPRVCGQCRSFCVGGDTGASAAGTPTLQVSQQGQQHGRRSPQQGSPRRPQHEHRHLCAAYEFMLTVMMRLGEVLREAEHLCQQLSAHDDWGRLLEYIVGLRVRRERERLQQQHDLAVDPSLSAHHEEQQRQLDLVCRKEHEEEHRFAASLWKVHRGDTTAIFEWLDVQYSAIGGSGGCHRRSKTSGVMRSLSEHQRSSLVRLEALIDEATPMANKLLNNEGRKMAQLLEQAMLFDHEASVRSSDAPDLKPADILLPARVATDADGFYIAPKGCDAISATELLIYYNLHRRIRAFRKSNSRRWKQCCDIAGQQQT
jgi:hypothetical protein